MDKKVRRLTIDDYDQIVGVWTRAGLPFRPNGRDNRELLAKEMARDNCDFIGMFDGDSLIALAIASFDGRRGWINRLAVDPDYRHHGIASELIGLCEEALSRFGVVVLCAIVDELNTPSMGLFGKNGFKCEKGLVIWTKRPRPDF